MSSMKDKMISGVFWRFTQQLSTQGIGFVISLVLARILSPDDYGLVAMMTVFTTIAMVFINVGFTSSVIQKKDLSDVDLNTIFYSGIVTSLILYGILFLTAPSISIFYREPQLKSLMRWESIVVVLGALYSVPQALFTRKLQFKKILVMNLVGLAVQGTVGITMAFHGFGVWSLIIGTLSNSAVCVVVAWCLTDWKPKLQFSGKSFHGMFWFSFQMLMASLLDTIFNNIRALIIGRQYSSEDLAYYNRGNQFPTMLMGQVDGAITTVLFSSLSKYQDNWDQGLQVLRRAMRTSLYICVPAMVGLAAVAEPLILFLLTEKWAASIPYVRLCAFMCITWPLSAEAHALNAIGRSDVTLKLKMVEKTVIFGVILFTYRISVSTMVLATVLAGYGMHIICMFVYRKYLSYKLWDQIKDIIPSALLSLIMGAAVYFVGAVSSFSSLVTLILQVLIGIGVYILESLILKNETFFYILDYILGKMRRKKK